MNYQPFEEIKEEEEFEQSDDGKGSHHRQFSNDSKRVEHYK
jgi:hypothetical protein